MEFSTTWCAAMDKPTTGDMNLGVSDAIDRAGAADDGERPGQSTYEDQLRDWARAIIAEQAPVNGGFALAPAFPDVPAANNGGGVDE